MEHSCYFRLVWLEGGRSDLVAPYIEFGHIRQPLLVWPFGLELTIEQIGRWRVLAPVGAGSQSERRLIARTAKRQTLDATATPGASICAQRALTTSNDLPLLAATMVENA